ncbi:hypothetical protein MNBD_ALPHA03-1784 [hydrothermal vent metagenome]|uniref:Uncharacterized protein n=1 Tax=hydrothermal vent metagenome TaxID=652676 RepID=A0A3B1AZ51_9ZZZZ
MPILAWFMLVSVVAKRTPLLLATIPVALIFLFEGLFFKSDYIISFVGRRLTGSHILDLENGFGQNLSNLTSHTTLEMVQSAAKPEFWLGLGIAAGLFYATILLRKRNSL